MDFSKIVKDAKEKAFLNNKPLKASDLPPKVYYPIQNVKMFETDKCKSVKVTLVDGRNVWLPFEYAQAMEKDHVENINAANNYEMAYLGKLGDEKNWIPNVDVRLKVSAPEQQNVYVEGQPGPSVRETQQLQRKRSHNQGNVVKVTKRYVIGEIAGHDITEGYYQLGDPIIISDDE